MTEEDFDDFLDDDALGIILAPPPKPKFTPTEDQARALANLNTWLDNWHRGDPYFVLGGYAGTGKTFCISELAKSGRYKPEQLVFTAPTNKAVKVLRNYLDAAGLSASPSRTIYSLLGLSMQTNGEVKELTSPEDPVDLSTVKLIVVDEGSMVNKFLMRAIEDFVSCPVIFMGDPAQLPPVGEITSPIWKIGSTDQLTKVMRYDNAILDLATRLRSIVDHPAPSIKIETDDPVFRVGKGDLPGLFEANLDAIKAGNAKVIAWRNVRVGEYNQQIRKLIFGAAAIDPWLPGDKIVATAQLKDLDDNTFMRTDEEAVVEACVVGHHPKYRDFEIFNLLVVLESGRKQTLRVLTPTGDFHLNNKLNQLSTDAKAGKRYLWREFWALKEAFHEIKHSYAITTHRSQGSSYNLVFVDLEDILLNKNRQEAFRSLYVAVTRAREAVYVF